MRAINIDWDIDEENVELPEEIDIPDGITDVEAISDYLSDMTGFCHKGFEIEDDDYDDEDDDWDYCYECSGYGDDYYFDDDGEMQCRCDECPFNPYRPDDWDD